MHPKTLALLALTFLSSLALPDLEESTSRDYADRDGDGHLDALTVGLDGRVRLLHGTNSGFIDRSVEAGLAALGNVTSAFWIAGLEGRGPRILLLGESGSAPRLLVDGGDGVYLDRSVEEGLSAESIIGVDLYDVDGVVGPELVLLAVGGLRVFPRPGAPDWTSSLIELRPLESGSRLDPSGCLVTGSARVGAGASGSPTTTWVANVPAVEYCASGLTDTSQPGACLQASSTPLLGNLFPLSQHLFVAPTGEVGIGTTMPDGALNVVGNRVKLEEPGTGHVVQMRTTGSALDLESQGAPLYVNNTTGEHVYLMGSKVGIGTSSPTAKLEVAGAVRTTSAFHVENTHVWSGQISVRDGASNVTGVSLMGNDGEHSVRVMDLSGAVTVRIDGEQGRVTTQVLQITGGSDVVEGFDTEEPCEPGTVVVIGREGEGHLRPSQEPYDRRVAGVASGAGGVKPGLRLGQDGVLDGATEVAMVGRVWVKTTTENGPVDPGDLLTTASLAGHAMRASDHERSFGAVLGKALSSLEEGTGLVLVLVNLQ